MLGENMKSCFFGTAPPGCEALSGGGVKTQGNYQGGLDILEWWLVTVLPWQSMWWPFGIPASNLAEAIAPTSAYPCHKRHSSRIVTTVSRSRRAQYLGEYYALLNSLYILSMFSVQTLGGKHVYAHQMRANGCWGPMAPALLLNNPGRGTFGGADGGGGGARILHWNRLPT